MVILPPNFSEEIWAHKVEVAGAAVFAVRDGYTLLMARVGVAAFSACVAAVSSVSPAVFFVRKKANAGAPFLASRLGVSARGGSVVAVVLVCAILRDELCKLVVECGKFRCDVGGGWWTPDGQFADGVHGVGRSSGWILMGRQVCHEGGEIIIVRLEFIAESVLEVGFERRGIEGDAVGEADLGEV